jgi:uncharacterized protein
LATALEQKLVETTAKKISQRGSVIYWTPGQDRNRPTVVLIHHMWGNHHILQRHVQLFHELGYNCATFNIYRASTIRDPHPFRFHHNFQSMHQLWAEQVKDVLDSLEGKKIIFAMSGPSIAGLIAASQRPDVTHFICDSGPFKEIWQCTYRLLDQIWHIPTPPLRALFTTGAVFLWGPAAFKNSQSALARWKKNVPILSIRGSLDPLVYPKNIEGIFKNHRDLNIQVWTLPSAHHLDGLKLSPELYREKIEAFLLPAK